MQICYLYDLEYSWQRGQTTIISKAEISFPFNLETLSIGTWSQQSFLSHSGDNEQMIECSQ